MALIQTDLFGWTQRETMQPAAATGDQPTEEELANAFIEHFGPWVDQHQKLLEDDTTVCETLIYIHKRFTRRQLRMVYKTPAWHNAWERFNSFYFTKRTRGNACFSEGWTFTVTMPELFALKQQALGKIRHDETLEYVWEENRSLCVYGYDGFLFLVATPEEFARLQRTHKPYWYDIAQPPLTLDGVELLIFGVDDYEDALNKDGAA